MRLVIDGGWEYNLPEETKIETSTGAVYKAQDLTLGRQVAVKCVRISGSTPQEKNACLEMARKEVRTMVLLEAEDAAVPKVYATHYDGARGMFYTVMQWIPGVTLEQKMNAGEGEFAGWMAALCETVGIMENKRLSHKDLKPANIMITPRGRVYLMDFNITLNTPNRIEGTMAYKAPEMSQGSKNVSRTKVDMYAIGVMLYERFTGAVPVLGRDYAKSKKWGARQTNSWDLFVEPIQKRPDMPQAMNDIIVKCMKWDPAERYATVWELKRELHKVVRRLGKGK